MSTKRYNGWANYATWRVALEWEQVLEQVEFDGYPEPELYEKAAAYKEAVESVIEDNYVMNPPTEIEQLMGGYAFAFLEDVDWNEIAQHHTDEDS